MSNGWTIERRLKQAKLIQRWKPWEDATGPRTMGGKNRSSKNAYKTTSVRNINKAIRELKQALRKQKESMNDFYSL